MAKIKEESAPVTSDDRYWFWRSQAFMRTALESTRSAASGWATSLTTFGGLIGLAAIFKGSDGVSGVKTGYQVAAAILILGSLAVILAAAIIAAIAAQGTTRWIITSADEFARDEQREQRRAARLLVLSRALSIGAFVVLLAAVGIWLLSPTPDNWIRLHRVGGDVICVPLGQPGITFALDDIVSVDKSATCGG